MMLYRESNSVKLPDMVLEAQKPKIVLYKTYKTLVLISWPNGRPCLLANEWLRSQCAKQGPDSKSKSPSTYASNLSFLLRYCYSKQVNLQDLDDEDVYRFSKMLTREQKKEHNGTIFHRRSNNQTRKIIQTAFRFLAWTQENFRSASSPVLIGTKELNPQITIEKVFNKDTGRYEITHIYLPPRTSPMGDKVAMPDEYISRIQDATFERTFVKAARFKSKSTAQETNYQIEYLYERRWFCMWFMQKTGLRPDELCETPLIENGQAEENGYVLIPTNKTRDAQRPLRLFRMPADELERFARYLNAREDFVASLRERKANYKDPSSLLLTVDGDPFKVGSLTREFHRLVATAGLTNKKVCLTMFRHRFITIEILYELKQITNADDPENGLWAAAARDSICRIVAAKTGHRRPSSLYAYFDMAFKFAGMFKTTEEAHATLSEIQSKEFDLTYKRHQLMKNFGLCKISEDLFNETLSWLDHFKADLDAMKVRVMSPNDI